MGRLFQVLGAIALVVALVVMPNVGHLNDWLPTYMACAISIVIAGIGVGIHRVEQLEQSIQQRMKETKDA